MSENDHGSLLEWNRLNIKNTEEALVEVMVSGLVVGVPILDEFSKWLLAVIGATIVILVTNIEFILPHLTATGFKVAGSMLVVSAIIGVIARYQTAICLVSSNSSQQVKEQMRPILEKYFSAEEKISDHIQKNSLEIETEIDFKNILNKFFSLFPSWAYWFLKKISNKKIEKISNDRLEAYRHLCSKVVWLGLFVFLEALFYILFAVVVLVYAQST